MKNSPPPLQKTVTRDRGCGQLVCLTRLFLSLHRDSSKNFIWPEIIPDCKWCIFCISKTNWKSEITPEKVKNKFRCILCKIYYKVGIFRVGVALNALWGKGGIEGGNVRGVSGVRSMWGQTNCTAPRITPVSLLLQSTKTIKD